MNHILYKMVAASALAGLLLFFVVPSVLALPGGGLPGPAYSQSQQGSQQATDVPGVLNRVRDWLVGILLVVAAIFIVVAAFMYITAQGNAETVKTANRMILYTVAAIVIALLASVIINVAKFFANG